MIKPKWRYWLILPALALTATSVFGYMVVAKGQTQIGEDLQNKVWQTIIDKGFGDARTTSTSFVYSDSTKYKFKPSNFATPNDPMSPDEAARLDSQYSFTISGMNFGVRSNGYTDMSNIEFPLTDTHLDAWFGNNGKKYSAGGDLKLKETEAYVKYNYNNDLKDFVLQYAGGTRFDSNKNQWIQINDPYRLDDLRKTLTEFLKPEQNLEFDQILKDNRLFDIKGIKGAKIIDGKATVQYDLALNKDRLRNVVSQSIDMDQYSSQDDKDFGKQLAFALIDKIQVRKFSAWIGVSDQKLYKMSISSNAISVAETLAQFEKAIKNPKNSVGAIGSPFDEDQGMKRAVLDTVKNMQFKAKIQIEYSAKNIGKQQEIKAPSKFVRATMSMYSSLRTFAGDIKLFKFK